MVSDALLRNCLILLPLPTLAHADQSRRRLGDALDDALERGLVLGRPVGAQRLLGLHAGGGEVGLTCEEGWRGERGERGGEV